MTEKLIAGQQRIRGHGAGRLPGNSPRAGPRRTRPDGVNLPARHFRHAGQRAAAVRGTPPGRAYTLRRSAPGGRWNCRLRQEG